MIKRIAYLLLTVSLVAGCVYPNDDIRTEDLDSVITFFDRATDLSGYITYALTEELLPITPDTNLIDDPDDILNPDPDKAQFILDKIEENMDALGYTKVDNEGDADILINAGYVVITTDVVGVYPCYDPWYWYYGGYWGYPGGYWGYPGYPYYYGYSCAYSYSYDVGTVIMQAYDNKNTVNEAFNVIWVGILRGLANTGGGTTRAEVGIDQAFAQTPIF